VKILVTGSAGFIGVHLLKDMQKEELEFLTFDRCAAHRDNKWKHFPGDLRNIHEIRRAMDGVDMVVHLGAIANAGSWDEDGIFDANVKGTHNVLLAASEAGVSRVVYFSSVNATGAVGGHKDTLYFPIDDLYPHHPMTPYQVSKHLGEEICRCFTERYDISTLCLRPVFVSNYDRYSMWREMGQGRQARWGMHDYWAYVDVRDVCSAVILSIQANMDIKHDTFLLAADDITMNQPTAALMAEHFPHAFWKNISAEEWFSENPYRTVIDCSHAHDVLGWRPQHSWRDLTD
jgi:nucleoside-diphosphate-sugar epimerase